MRDSMGCNLLLNHDQPNPMAINLPHLRWERVNPRVADNAFPQETHKQWRKGGSFYYQSGIMCSMTVWFRKQIWLCQSGPLGHKTKEEKKLAGTGGRGKIKGHFERLQLSNFSPPDVIISCRNKASNDPRHLRQQRRHQYWRGLYLSEHFAVGSRLFVLEDARCQLTIFVNVRSCLWCWSCWSLSSLFEWLFIQGHYQCF